MTRGRLVALTGSGAALLACNGLALLIQWQDNLDRFLAVALLQAMAYLVAVWAVWDGGSSRRVALAIAAVAALLRIPIVLTPPYLSSDLYRYVWDGRVEAAGINPYSYIPDDPHLEALRDTAIYPQINRRNYAHTIYPPAAEAIFLAVTRLGETETVMKAAMVGFEIITFLLLLRLLDGAALPTGRVVVYAWHPLPLWEFAGSGHIDAALIAFVVAALWAAQRNRGGLAGLFLAGAALTKLYPAVLLPALYRRWGWALPTVFASAIVLAYLPFIDVGWHVLGFLPAYTGEEGFGATGTGFYLLGLLRQVPGLAGLSGQAYMAGSIAVLAALGAVAVFARDSARPPFAAATVLATTFMLLVSPHYAWYFAWLIVFACFVRSFALLWLTNACLLFYLVPVGSQIVRDDQRLMIESMMYGPFAALALVDLWYHRRCATRSN